jgi:hypothetical protein
MVSRCNILTALQGHKKEKTMQAVKEETTPPQYGETNLANEEIEILLEALESWESKGSAGRLMSSMMTGLMSKNLSEREQKELEERDRQAEEKYAFEVKARRNKSVLLQAKLIRMMQGH